MNKCFFIVSLLAFMCSCNGCEGLILEQNNLEIHNHLAGVSIHCEDFYQAIEFEKVTESTVYVHCVKVIKEEKKSE